MTEWLAGPPDTSSVLAGARELAERGEYEAASAYYARGVGNPDPQVHTAALLGLADSRYRLDDEEGALQAWLAATQAPETALSWQAWVALAGARVRQGDLVGATRSYREAERRAPPEERAAIASRLGWLNKEMGNTGSAERYFGRARVAGAFVPLVTYGILAVTIGIGLSGLLDPQLNRLWFELFGLDKAAVAAGEYWRLLTVVLVHGGLMHLAFNMYALYIVGPIVESMYGRVVFLGVYLLTAALGSVASYLFVQAPSVGASGAIFGLFGALLVASRVHRPLLGRQARSLTGPIAILIAFNLALGFGLGAGLGVNIDNAAHIGGLIAGAWLGLAVLPRATLAGMWQRPGQPAGAAAASSGPRLIRQLVAMLVVLGAVLVGVSLTPLWA